MALRRRLFQNFNWQLIGFLAVILAVCINVGPIGAKTMLTPETSPNAVFATERLQLKTLRPEPTPKIALRLDADQLAKAFPELLVARNTTSVVDGWETLELRFTRDGDPAGSIKIVRVEPIDALERTIKINFALFSGPIDDLVVHPDQTLDLLASFSEGDTYAWAVRGSFFTSARGSDAKNIAKTVTDLLFVRN